jgi:hypothetical protein
VRDQDGAVGCHIPARAMSATISTICEATAETARAGPLDLDVAMATVR